MNIDRQIKREQDKEKKIESLLNQIAKIKDDILAEIRKELGK